MRRIDSKSEANPQPHILDVVEKLCTRVIVLHEGRVVADDSVKHLRTLLASSSLEEVFAHLVLRHDPERIARDIAEWFWSIM